MAIRKRSDLVGILHLIESIAVVHNFLLQGQPMTIPQQWYDDITRRMMVYNKGEVDDTFDIKDNNHDRRVAVSQSIISQYRGHSE